MTEKTLKVCQFVPKTTNQKEQATKVLEEAAEVFGAWQAYDTNTEGIVYVDEMLLVELADEIADVITAASNLAYLMDLDIEAAMDRCIERNRNRGRY